MTEKKHYYVNNEVIEILESVKKNVPGISNHSQALRFIVLKYDNQIESKEDKKYNAISKEVSMALEITANIAEKLNVLNLEPVSGLSSYTLAKETVEDRMKRNTTKAMRYKNKTMSTESKALDNPSVTKWDD